MKTVTTGQLLVERGACTPELLEKAQKAARAAGTKLCSQLLAMGACDEQTLAAVLADKHGLPGVDLSRTVIALDVLSRVPRQVAEAELILPLSEEGGRIHLAVSVIDARVIDEIRFVSGLEISTYVAVLGSLRRTISGAYDALASGATTWRGASASAGLASLAVVLPGDGSAAGPARAESGVGPLPEGDEPAPDEIEISLDGGEGEVVAEERALAGPKRILVVDDEPEIRKLVARALEAKGFSIDAAADGAEALAKISATLPDLVVLDAMLPRVHGFEVCLKVRSDPRTRRVPVIIMTALYRGWRFAQDARENYGAEDYIEKPFHIDDFLRRVEAVLQSTAGRDLRTSASAEQLLRRGKELLLAGRLEEAAAELGEAIRNDPFSADAHYQLARVLRARGEHFRAMTAFEQAVELRGDFFAALRSLVALYTEKGFRRKAAETLERALAVAPDEPTRQAIRADLLKLL